MGEMIREVMTSDLVTLPLSASVRDAARAMRDEGIGDVIVLDDAGMTCGIVTDRDIAVRAVAEGRDTTEMAVAEICSRELQTVSSDDTVGDAVQLMTEKAIRRLPVVKDGRLVGVISIGDVAVSREPDSALAEISSAPPND
jgi:signal-transduction protein with cAMP-binding, CBS, and nucleotidyltransferase domain